MMKLNEKEVNAEIALRESSELNRATLQDLANLYVVRDHFFGFDDAAAYKQAYSRSPAPEASDKVGIYGGSDFLKAIAGKDHAAVWAIMDELMDTLLVVNERVYGGVLRKIEKLP